jgi:hypothetical protein
LRARAQETPWGKRPERTGNTFGKRYGQDFTQDKAKLLAAVERFNGGIDKAALGEYRRAFNEFDASAASLYFATVSTLRGLAKEMAALPEAFGEV